MNIDKNYCMNSFLTYRKIMDETKTFSEKITPRFYRVPDNRKSIHNSAELYITLKEQMVEATKDGKAAIALSGGIDSAILAHLMPKGSMAYTFKCIVPGVKVTDETTVAAKYAEECGLEHKVVEVLWEDFETYAPILMKYKGAPIHSIEVQIYKAALQAKQDGFERMIYGEAADVLFGGLNSLLSKDWLVGDFFERYAYVMPYKALREPELILEPILDHEKDGHIDAHEFLSTELYKEALGSYYNAVETAEMKIVMPYSHCILGAPLDYERVRSGENKYLVREVFANLYPDFEQRKKLPMPRATNEWFKEWKGPTRPEFWPHCTDNMTGDQKWLVWCLERFLNEFNIP